MDNQYRLEPKGQPHINLKVVGLPHIIYVNKTIIIRKSELEN